MRVIELQTFVVRGEYPPGQSCSVFCNRDADDDDVNELSDCEHVDVFVDVVVVVVAVDVVVDVVLDVIVDVVLDVVVVVAVVVVGVVEFLRPPAQFLTLTE